VGPCKRGHVEIVESCKGWVVMRKKQETLWDRLVAETQTTELGNALAKVVRDLDDRVLHEQDEAKYIDDGGAHKRELAKTAMFERRVRQALLPVLEAVYATETTKNHQVFMRSIVEMRDYNTPSSWWLPESVERGSGWSRDMTSAESIWRGEIQRGSVIWTNLALVASEILPKEFDVWVERWEQGLVGEGFSPTSFESTDGLKTFLTERSKKQLQGVASRSWGHVEGQERVCKYVNGQVSADTGVARKMKWL
jgi:hypothetical protein